MTTSTSRTVVVHGATGTQGAPVVRRLLTDGLTVRAAVRTPRDLPDGVEPVHADLLDVDSLRAAYREADAVVVQLPLEFDPRRAVPQAEAVLAALAAAGVPRVVFNPSGPLLPALVGHPYLDARAVLGAGLRDLEAATAIVGPAGPYMENLSSPWSSERIARTGEIAYPLPEQAPVPWVTLDDLADAVAQAVAGGSPGVRILAGPQALTGTEVAAALSRAAGRELTWTTVGATEYESMLAPHLGATAAAGIAGFYGAPAPDGPPPGPAPEPAATTLEEWATRRTWG